MTDINNVPAKRGRPRKDTGELEVDSIDDTKVAPSEAAPIAAKAVEEQDEYQIEVIKDYYGKVDVFYLSKKDPRFEYRFLRDDFKNLSVKTGNLLFQKGGWELVNRTHLKSIGIQERFISADGFYRVGDTILARIPKELFIEKEKVKLDAAQAPMKAVRKLLKEGDPSASVGMHESLKGIQTAEQMGMK